MIQGVGTRHASQSRTPIEARTIAARTIGAAAAVSSWRARMRSGRRPSAAGSVAKPDLAKRARDLAQLSIGLREPDIGHRFGDLRDNCVLDERAAGPLLERRAVKLRYPVERMLPLHVLERPTRHLRPQLAVARKLRQNGRQHVDLPLANRNLRRHIVRKLAEPADVRDDERTAQHERADRDPGRLAHRRKAQVDADIAALEERPEFFLVRVAEGLHLLADPKVRALEERVEVKVWRGRPDEEETGGRKLLQETPKRLEQLRDTFGRRQVADAGDDGRAPIHL